MPLDLHNDNQAVSRQLPVTSADPVSGHLHDISSLRVSLIGNRDLKFKLVRDKAFVHSITTDFHNHIAVLLNKNPQQFVDEDETFINDLETKIVILKILSVFIDEIDFKHKLTTIDNINIFDKLIYPLSSLLNYYVSVFIPFAYNHKASPELVSKFENIISYALDIFIGLNNERELVVNFDQETSVNVLWKFVTTLLIVTDATTIVDNTQSSDNDAGQTSVPLVSNNLLLKLLKLIPFLIASSKDNKYTNSYMITLLSTIIKRLEQECNNICQFHFPHLDQLEATSEYFNEISFKDSNLPNIEPNSDFFQTKINLQLLIDLITGTAQIFSHFRATDRNVVMIIPQQQDSMQFTQPHGSPVVVLPIKVYLSLLLTLKYDHKLLNLVSLNLIHLYLNNLIKTPGITSKEIKNEAVKNYKKIFPRIVEQLELDYDSDNGSSQAAVKTENQNQKPETKSNDPKYIQAPKYLESAVRILCTLCLGSRFARDEIRRCNVDYKIMYNLSMLVRSDYSLENMNKLKRSSKNGTKLVDFTNLIDLENHQKNVNDNISKNNSVLRTKEKSPRKVKRCDQLETLGDYFLLLSIYVGDKEEYRYRIVEYKPTKSPKNLLAQLTFELIDNYRFLLMQIQIIYKILHNKEGVRKLSKQDLIWFGKNLGIILSLIGHEFYFSVFHLIRSLSRSVSTLRTFFVECNSFTSILDLNYDIGEASLMANSNGNRNAAVNSTPSSTTIPPTDNSNNAFTLETVGQSRETGLPMNGSFISNILHILRINEDLDKIIQFFCSMDDKLHDDYKKFLKFTNPLNKSIILGTVANFVLDFCSFRYDVVNDEYFLRNLAKIYKNSVHNVANTKERSEILQYNSIQLTIFQILKNYLFNENQENKRELLEFIPISIILDKSLNGLIIEGSNKDNEDDEELKEILLKQKILAFDILRNLTAGSLYFSEIIKSLYEEYCRSNANIHRVPRSWNSYLIENILNFENFVSPGTANLDHNMSVVLRFSMFSRDDEFLARLISNENYVRLITSLNYIEDHRFTNISNFKQENFPLDELLFIWKRFLELKLTPKLEKKITKNDLNLKIELNNNLNEIRLSVVWILISLTFNSDDTGYQYPDTNNFRLYDIIRNDSASSNLNAQGQQTQAQTPQRSDSTSGPSNNYRIVIDDSDDENELSVVNQGIDINSNVLHNLDEEKADGNRMLSPSDRAKILYRHGFSSVLDSLQDVLSSSMKEEFRRIIPTATDSNSDSTIGNSGRRDAKSNTVYSIKRFDELNSHELLEKVKTANYQINSLIRGDEKDDMIAAQPILNHQIRRRSSNVITSGGGAKPSVIPGRRPILYPGTVAGGGVAGGTVRRASSVIGPDVNRGGEGFGYGSDEDYVDADDGRGRNFGDEEAIRESESEDDMDEELNDDDDDDANDNDNEEEEYPDDYWVRWSILDST